jgi:hypothetical protein
MKTEEGKHDPPSLVKLDPLFATGQHRAFKGEL